MAATVELTSKPAPLVGEPKLSPTVPMVASLEDWSSLTSKWTGNGLENTDDAVCITFQVKQPRASLRTPSVGERTALRGGCWSRRQRQEAAAGDQRLLQQLGDFLLHAVGLGQGGDAGLAQDLVLGHVGGCLGIVRGLDRILQPTERSQTAW